MASNTYAVPRDILLLVVKQSSLCRPALKTGKKDGGSLQARLSRFSFVYRSTPPATAGASPTSEDTAIADLPPVPEPPRGYSRTISAN